MAVEAATYRFNVEEYHKLADAGILGEDDRIELLDGELVVMSPIGHRHSLVVNRLNEFFVDRRRGRYVVSPQNPVTLDPRSEPQPDLLLLRTEAKPYERRTPHPSEVLLLIEVADASLDYDRGAKLRAYARTGIAEFWIVNLRAETIETYRDPDGLDYRHAAHFALGESVAPAAFPDLVVQVAEIVR